MKEFFIDVSDDLLTDMRLIVEGAVNIFEHDASPLNRLARDNDMMTAYRALSTIGSALYDLRKISASLKKPIQGKQSDNLKRKIKHMLSLTQKSQRKTAENPAENRQIRKGNSVGVFADRRMEK